MKYGNFCNQGRTNINMGDYLQFWAVSCLYEQMGVPDSDVRYIGQCEAIDYCGETMILPINSSIHLFTKEGKIAISPDITPVFLGIMITTVERYDDVDSFLQEPHNRDYFLRYSPIGCRDETTYDYLVKYGIPAYINGCLTVTFPKVSELPGKSVIFADVPKDLLEWIPDWMLNSHIIFRTQQKNFTEEEIRDYPRVFDFVRSSYDFLKQNAKLVVTSRLHVALPCTAYGIPAILVKDHVDTRFSFIERYLPIYDCDRYADINWSPEVPDIEPLKERLINLAINRIQVAVETVKSGELLTAEFKARSKQGAYTNSHTSFHQAGYRFTEYAKKYWVVKEKAIKYALWGVNANTAEYWKNFIESQYPNAELVAVLDRYKQGSLSDISIPLQNPDALACMPDVCVIVCAISARSDALNLFKHLEFTPDRYVFVSDEFLTREDITAKLFSWRH